MSTPSIEAQLIAGRTLDEWREFARRDNCLKRMVPSDLRQIIGRIAGEEAALARADKAEAERDAALAEAERLREAGNNLRALFWPYASDEAQVLGLKEWNAAIAKDATQ